MKTLIVPCGGKSSRFPGMRPKWLLTHPDGQLMIQKALHGLEDKFDQIIISIIKQHDVKYSASKILRQALTHLEGKLKICVLDDFTQSASETVDKTLQIMGVSGSFVIKDSDNMVEFVLPLNSNDNQNFIVGLDLKTFKQAGSISNIQAKSFLKCKDNLVLSIREKEVVSSVICVGVYGFSSVEKFHAVYEEMKSCGVGELYISHIVSRSIDGGDRFNYIEAEEYNDWGTFKEWRREQKKYSTYFCDFDGVLIKNSGQYGELNWSNNSEMLIENCQKIKALQEIGAQVVITTSRPDSEKDKIRRLLGEVGIIPFAIITGLNHAPRIVVNDFAPSNPFPSCNAISLPRNGNLADYLD